MRVLIASISWPPETFLARLLEGLLTYDYIELTVASEQRPSKEWFSNSNFKWIHAPGWSGPKARRLTRVALLFAKTVLRAPGSLKWIAKESSEADGQVTKLQTWYRHLPFTTGNWDIIYIPWIGGANTYGGLLKLDIPVIVSCRGSQVNVYPHNPQKKHLDAQLRTAFEQVDIVHCVSDDIKREAFRYGLNPAKAVVIRPAVDPDFFHLSTSELQNISHFCVVSTGSLIWHKGYEYALIAIRRLVDRGIPVRYDIIGTGNEQQRLLYTIYDLDLVDHVRLLGQLRPTEVRDRLQQADAFLLSSLSEGISNAVLEAMACGLPIVTTDCGGMREAVTNSVEGFVVPTRDPLATAEALVQLSQDPELRRRMGAAARQRVLQDFQLEDQVVQFVRLFRGRRSIINRATIPFN